MLIQTLSNLSCPSCHDELFLSDSTESKRDDILFGSILCRGCNSHYPILAGVAILVQDVEGYLASHVKGISALVGDHQIPENFRASFLEAKNEIETEHIEEDLESMRINALYFMNHYLSTRTSKWWKPKKGSFNKEIDQLVRRHWDHGPFSVIKKWTTKQKNKSIVELGCGVGGLAQHLEKSTSSFLGVDSSFASIALARHIHNGAPYGLEIKIPQDLMDGGLTGTVKLPQLFSKKREIDFIVGELQSLPIKKGAFDLSIALNAIDMLESPADLPKIQSSLVHDGGLVIQSCPYIWHDAVSKQLRKILPKKNLTSASAVEYLYEKAGLKILKRVEHQPWLFFKHFRQIELYSVHVFMAEKRSQK